MKWSILFTLFVLIQTAGGASATVPDVPVESLFVPSDYVTIQEALDAGANGSRVIVGPGTYVENIDFKGKSIVLESSHGPEVTVIDGDTPPDSVEKSVVTFRSGEDENAKLIGFTITHGAGNQGLGGGIFVYGASPVIENNIITDNKAGDMWFEGQGGGMFLYDSKALVRNNIITDNESLSGGGGISCVFTSSANLKNQFIFMKCPSGPGASSGNGSMKNYLKTPTIENNLISGNRTSNAGGGIHCAECPATIRQNTISGNYAWSGGGLFCVSAGPVVSGNLISGNRASTSGGGVHLECSNPLFSNNIVKDNRAWRGGGFASDSSTPAFANNIVSGNRASSSGMSGVGGGFACTDSTVHMVNNTVYGNTSDHEAGGLALVGSYATVSNTIFWNDQAPIGMEISSVNGSGLFISHSDVMGGMESVASCSGNTLEWGIGMISSDPRFADGASGDFHLLGTSPCWNEGDTAMPGLPEEDFEGDPRVANGAVDMGADEFHPHLYFTGAATPGGKVKIKLIAPPRCAFIQVLLGTGVLDPPVPCMFGDWYLAFPVLKIASALLVPPEGLLEFAGVLPSTVPAPYMLPMQALMGGFELSNLCQVEVK